MSESSEFPVRALLKLAPAPSEDGAAGLQIGALLRALSADGGETLESLRGREGLDQVDETVRLLRQMGMICPAAASGAEVELTADGEIARDLELSTPEHAFSLSEPEASSAGAAALDQKSRHPSPLTS